MIIKLFWIFLWTIFCLLIQKTNSVYTYRAAVVEYNPVDKEVPKNVVEYSKLMKVAKEKGAEIIVFPEGGLNNRLQFSPIPAPFEKIAPCTDTSYETTDTIKKLSCASKDSAIYSVINLPEKRDCKGEEDCPERGYFIFNTNVVFDRKGMVIARYAKFNLFDEIGTDRTAQPELSFFDTDFGVRFGTFTCFDILFPTPTLQLFRQFGITDFVFTTRWFSELPFLTAFQTQQGWAQSNNVNLLASGYNLPEYGSTGSGIFNGKFGPLVAVMLEKKATRVLVADVPTNKSDYQNNIIKMEFNYQPEHLTFGSKDTEVEPKNFTLLSDQIDKFNSVVIKTGSFNQEICSKNDFCCKFNVDMESLKKSDYYYRAVVLDGVRKFGLMFTGGVQVCGVVLCNGPYIKNCTNRVKDIPGMFKFKKIEIEGHFNLKNSMQMPTTLTDGEELSPLPPNKYTYKVKEKDNSKIINLELIWPVTNLHSFAIWGRDYVRDGQPPSLPHSSASSVLFYNVFSILMFFFLHLIIFQY